MIQTVSNFGGSSSLPVKSVYDLLCRILDVPRAVAFSPVSGHHSADGQLAD